MAKQRWVVKIGSQMVCDGGPVLIRDLIRQVRTLRSQHDIEVIWVTSGAIASAVERTSFKKNKAGWRVSQKQALSAIGQPILMDTYNLATQSLGILGAQVLVSYRDFTHPDGKKNLSNTINELLNWKVLPIINENDAVATEEIKFGDNDSLSAKIAIISGADKLVILTDVDGLYDSDPKKNKNAELIPRLNGVPSNLIKQLDRGASKVGTGGMYSKICAAQLASSKGVETVLVRGNIDKILIRLASGEKNIGTTISPRRKS